MGGYDELLTIEQIIVNPTSKRGMNWFLRIIGTEWTAIVCGMLADDYERSLPELLHDESAMDPRHA